MYHITTETATQDHEFTDGDELQSIPPTDLNALWFNMIQRELLAVLAGCGVTPNAANFTQIWGCLQKIGLKVVVSTEGNVDVSAFGGATVVLCSARDFSIEGSLQTNSMVVIIPWWYNASPNQISVTYNNEVTDIKKGFAFFGAAVNGTDELQLAGSYFPVTGSAGNATFGALGSTSFSTGSMTVSGQATIAGLVVGTLLPVKLYDPNMVTFTEADQTTWQLMENWQVYQVKRVHYNMGNSVAASVLVAYKTDGTTRSVVFRRECYIEFICIGTCTIGGTQYAVLLNSQVNDN